jgi:hypothetical protein
LDEKVTRVWGQEFRETVWGQEFGDKGLGTGVWGQELGHEFAARQTTENIIRIAQDGYVKVVQMVNILILARLFKVKLT